MSTETVKLIRTESPGRPPRLSHSSWTLCVYEGEGVLKEQKTKKEKKEVPFHTVRTSMSQSLTVSPNQNINECPLSQSHPLTQWWGSAQRLALTIKTHWRVECNWLVAERPLFPLGASRYRIDPRPQHLLQYQHCTCGWGSGGGSKGGGEGGCHNSEISAAWLSYKIYI